MGMTANGDRVSFGGDRNIQKLTLVIATQHCEYSRNHLIAHFKRGKSHGMCTLSAKLLYEEVQLRW